MTSNKLQYFSQTDFSKGIETRQEMLGKGQVLDAQNMWAFLSECGQRPGTAASRYIAATTAVGVSHPTVTVWTDVSAVTDAVLTPGVSNLNGLAYGDIITFPFAALNEIAPDTTVANFNLTSSIVQNAVSKTRCQLQGWTSRGWVPIYFETTREVATETVSMFPFAPTHVFAANVWTQPLSMALPADMVSATKTFQTGSYTGYFFRIIITSATDTTGSPFTAGVIYGRLAGGLAVFLSYTSIHVPSALNGASRTTNPGTFYTKFAGGNQVVTLWITPQTTATDYTGYPKLILSVAPSLTRNNVPPVGWTGSIDTPTQRYDLRYKALSAPPSVAVIPEFNTSFIAYCNLVFEIPYYGLNPWYQTDVYVSGGVPTNIIGPKVAAVNADPLIVGPISVANPAVPYSNELVPQLSNFPEANLIVYFKDRLWVAGLLGSPNLLRWSGSATDGGYNVWPEQSQVPLSTAKDNSEITAIAPLGDNLVVFKKNSIWQMIDNGLSDTGPQLALYEPRLVVAGVGTVSHQSVQAVNGGLVFLAEDGFYFYDGTPNIRRISDSIKDFVDSLSPGRMPFAVSTVWRTKQLYVCAASTQAEYTENDRIFVYDYQNGGWWIWNGLDVQCWFQQDGVGLKEELYALDSTGRAYQIDKWTQSDNGANIDSYFLTARMGFNDVVTKTALDVRVRGINNNSTVTMDVITEDFETVSNAVITMPRDEETQYADNPPYGSGTDYCPPRRRERKHSIRETGAWFQLRLQKMLKVFGIDLGVTQESRR